MEAASPRATDRGLALLRVVAEHADGISLANAARLVDLSPSTALRQLRALEAAGFAERLEPSGWRPGQELLRLARHLTSTSSLAQSAAPVLAELARSSGESCYLVEPLDHRNAAYTAMAEGTHAIRHVSWLGRTVPLVGTAAGAALAGRVDSDGCAVVSDAVEEGVTAIAVAVRGTQGKPIAALSVVGPSFRLLDELLADMRAHVSLAALQLSAAMGAPDRAAADSRVVRVAGTR
jgi:DNA-binding IclR family transcriptional regulator